MSTIPELRVRCGGSAGAATDALFPILYAGEDRQLVIEGRGPIQTIEGRDGSRVFLAGDIVGVRDRSGRLRPDGPLDVHLFASGRSEDVEGRFLAVAVAPDGRCEIYGDRFGQMDCYYQRSGDETIFATSLDSLPIASSGGPLDVAGVAHSLTVFGYRPPKQHTIYADVHRLGVRDRAVVSNGTVKIVADDVQPPVSGAYGERELHEYADLFIEAVRVRASRYGNVVYLSSGWDSTAILACLVHLFGARKVRGVIGRMRYASRSGVINQFEIDRAKAFADYYGVSVEIAELDYRNATPALMESLGPLFRSHHMASITGLNHALLAEHVANTSTGDESVFAGEISDGAHNLGFSQFVTMFHPVHDFREYSDKMLSYLFGPTFRRALVDGTLESDPIYALFRSRAGSARFDAPAADEVAKTRQLFASFFLRGNRLPLWSLENTAVLTAAGREFYAATMEQHYLDIPAKAANEHNLYGWYLHMYNSFHWQGSTVMTLPVTAKAAGLRLMLPFYDSALQEFLAAMPESWGRGLDLRPTKYPLKWTLANRLKYPMHLQTGPHSYIYDIDPRFSLAAEFLYDSAFTPVLRDRLKGDWLDSTLDPAYFDTAYLRRIGGRYLAGDEASGAEMNDLIALCFFQMFGRYGDS